MTIFNSWNGLIFATSFAAILFLFPFISYVLPPIQADSLIESVRDEVGVNLDAAIRKMTIQLSQNNFRLSVLVCTPLILISLFSFLSLKEKRAKKN